MPTHIAYVGFISRAQRTSKTLCKRVVSVSIIATDHDADCDVCRKERETDVDVLRSTVDYARKTGAEIGEDLQRVYDAPISYRTRVMTLTQR